MSQVSDIPGKDMWKKANIYISHGNHTGTSAFLFNHKFKEKT